MRRPPTSFNENNPDCYENFTETLLSFRLILTNTFLFFSNVLINTFQQTRQRATSAQKNSDHLNSNLKFQAISEEKQQFFQVSH